ncbi:phosphate signaling complex protein PhoU [Paludisphaera mucosa]|uniref:Phosphate-specific transport system accessory protein PhoU n=1 Tax=Paludisphaera mucosa TaxID=3030827 RepID=A0ABT6FJU3_9BACT|nr:phosphate signaling complex protein PhoU [Paludisphaera mucosa]MDG3007817.1 phosphate signaling complex protein PhoU [Paludisphaera mucosa]
MYDDPKVAAAPSPWTWDEPRTSVGRHFLRDLEGLWADVLRLAAVVEEDLERSIRALCDGSVGLAAEIRSHKPDVDLWEVTLERECVRVLALHQPVASDLRRVAAVLKINGDLERLADLARHIAKRVGKLAADPRAFPVPQPLENLATAALGQVRRGLDALTRADVVLAQQVIAADRGVDHAYRSVVASLKRDIVADPARADAWLRFVSTARNLERIADHAARIAEVVLYLKEGAAPAPDRRP